MQTATALAEIYTSEAGAVYQCDRQNRLLLSYGGALTVMKLDAFLRLKRTVDSISLHEMAASTSRSADLEIVTVCGCERCFILDLPQLLAFKELLDGAKFMLSLNSVLHECLQTAVA
ncbi:hypothetical protein [Pontibacter liquoris]|uniref:hypothetical protein n=1 Tax=Pontibacter liquoris TaxID=2905677 RepID=UPI001FA80FC0|nr:hypothetical protein [Pontibacter liquoris]